MEDPKTISTSSVNVEQISTGAEENVELHPGLIHVLISYPESYTGPRHLIEGKTYPMSKEAADQLIAKGIASLAESAVEAPAKEEAVNKKTSDPTKEIKKKVDDDEKSAGKGEDDAKKK